MALSDHWTIDFEADGPVPGLYNPISMAIVNVADTSIAYTSGIYPMISNPGIEGARAISGISYETQLTYPKHVQVANEIKVFLNNHTGDHRPIFWSDNPGFDWPYFNYLMISALGNNPFGYSCRRIGDYWAGLQNNPRDTKGWKKKTTTRHTHDPLDDARKMAEGVKWMLTI